MADAEVDTFLEGVKEVSELKQFGTALSITSSIKSLTSEDKTTDPRYATKLFFFDRFERDVYCDVTSVWVRLVQTAEGAGSGYLTFDQDCESRRSDQIEGWDWSFPLELFTEKMFFIRTIYLGTWSHVCHKKFVELKEDFTWIPGSINPVANAKYGRLHWTRHKQVHHC